MVKRYSVYFLVLLCVYSSQIFGQRIPIVIAYFPSSSNVLCFDRKIDYKENWNNIARRYAINVTRLKNQNNANTKSVYIKQKNIQVPLILNSNLFTQSSKEAGATYIPIYYLIQKQQRVSQLSTKFSELLLVYIKSANKLKDGYILKANAPILIGYLRVNNSIGGKPKRYNKNYKSVEDLEEETADLSNLADIAPKPKAQAASKKPGVVVSKKWTAPKPLPVVLTPSKVVAPTKKYEPNYTPQEKNIGVNSKNKYWSSKYKQLKKNKGNAPVNNFEKQVFIKNIDKIFDSLKEKKGGQPPYKANNQVIKLNANDAATPQPTKANVNAPLPQNNLTTKATTNVAKPQPINEDADNNNTNEENNNNETNNNGQETEQNNSNTEQEATQNGENGNGEAINAENNAEQNNIDKEQQENVNNTEAQEEGENIANKPSTPIKVKPIISKPTPPIEAATNANISTPIKTDISEQKIIPKPVVNEVESFFKPEYEEDLNNNSKVIIADFAYIKTMRMLFDESDNKYYVITNLSPPGSIVKLSNGKTRKTVYCRVISKLPNSLAVSKDKNMVVLSELLSQKLSIKEGAVVNVEVLK